VKKEKIKAVIDVDMIGFLDKVSFEPSVVYMANSLKNKKFNKRLKAVNEAGPKLKIKYLSHASLYANEQLASDGVIFFKQKFPVLTFHNTNQYPYSRTPEDTPDKISWDIYLQRVKYIFLSAWLLANE
jgi:Zn-dependent M28 family amino/carboxypeptidase